MQTLDDGTLAFVRAASGAASVEPGAVLQPLWSGFGRKVSPYARELAERALGTLGTATDQEPGEGSSAEK